MMPDGPTGVDVRERPIADGQLKEQASMTGSAGTVTSTVEDAPRSAATRVVLVDARPERRAVMRQMFEHSDVAATVVGEANSQTDAVVAVQHDGADLVVLDLQEPVQDGLDTVAALHARFPALVILVCSFNSDVAIKRRALDEGADAYLVKPVGARQVMATMQGVPPRASAMQSTTS
jgi:DNA-binding NarL/FixJ family response regulator